MLVRVLEIFLGALALYLVLGWLTPLHPLLEAITNVRAQVSFLALVPLVGFGFLRSLTLVGVSALVLGLLAAALVPYWGATPDPAHSEAESIRVMQYNVYFGNSDFDRITQHIIDSDAQVVALHELLPEQWAELEPLLGEAYPFRIAAPLAEIDGQPGGGMALLSRTPLQQVAMPTDVSPVARVILVATTEIARQEVTVIGLHPHASRSDSAKVRLREAQMRGVAELVQQTPGPAIIMTDLNIAPTSPAYSGFLDELGWRDPHRLVGWQASWPTWGGAFGLPIDHVFVSDHFGLHSYTTGDGGGSDHNSVTAHLSLTDVRSADGI